MFGRFVNVDVVIAIVCASTDDNSVVSVFSFDLFKRLMNNYVAILFNICYLYQRYYTAN